jgi:hypothetical protein
MKKNVGLGLKGFFLLISINSFAQSYFDEALYFSRTNPGGSARIQALGGAQVAVGGDYNSAFSNPAGLGFFNKSEATFSLGTNFYNSSSNYFGQSTNDSKSNFNVPGFSVVLHSDKNQGKLVSGNFAISLTRTNNFNQNFTYQGFNPQNSLIDHFIEESDGYGRTQFITYQPDFYINPYEYVKGVAYSNFLMGPLSETTLKGDTTTYQTKAQEVPVFQHERVQTSGAQNQVNFAYGVNFNDRFYLGGAVGLPSFNYSAKSTYSETFTAGPLIGYDLTQDYSVKGSGINATIGAIMRPTDFVQFGLSVATPTYYYSIANSLNCTLSSSWNNYSYVDVTAGTTDVLNGRSASLGEVIGNYSLTTPWRLKGGLTLFVKKHGFITAEVERVDYSRAKYSSQTDYLDFSTDPNNYGNYANHDIQSYYTSVLNIRGGGEYRYKNFRVRAGYSYMPDPYISVQDNVNYSISSITGGVGYRTGKFFVDLAYSLTTWNRPYEPYYIDSYNYPNHGPIPVVQIHNTNSSAMVTVGFNL